MNDRFRYRVWDKTQNRWLHFDFSTYPTYQDRIWQALTDGETFYQCTGVKDKNGKLIYEGDIVKDISLNMTFKVGYKKCAFYLENEEHIRYFHELAAAYSEKRLEVVGNIYENKELLDEQ